MAAVADCLYLRLFLLSSTYVYGLEPMCEVVDCSTPLHSKIGSKFSMYGLTQSCAIFIVDMMTFVQHNFLHDLEIIDRQVKPFDCSTASVHLVSTSDIHTAILEESSRDDNSFEPQTLGNEPTAEGLQLFIVDAPKARIILPSCNWTVHEGIMYCEIYWPAAKFERINICYQPKYYYGRENNILYFLCYGQEKVENKKLFVEEGLNLKLSRYGYEDIGEDVLWIDQAMTVDHHGQIIAAFNDIKGKFPNLQNLLDESALNPKAERLLSCDTTTKIRFVLQTMLMQICIRETSYLFRFTVQLLPQGVSETTLINLVELIEPKASVDNRLPINVLPLIVTRQRSMIEELQMPPEVFYTINMETLIHITLAIPLYTCFIIIIGILFIRWGITLFP